MASKRHHKRKQCTRKIRYPDRDSAEKRAAIQRWKTGCTRYHAYPCKYCGGWHVGRRRCPNRNSYWR